MPWRADIAGVVILGLVLAVGGAGLAFTVAAREGDAALLRRHANPPAIRAADVATGVRAALQTARAENRARHAACRPGARGPLRNPWRCLVRLRSARARRYAVTVSADGSFRARPPGGAVLHSCCIRVPTGG